MIQICIRKYDRNLVLSVGLDKVQDTKDKTIDAYWKGYLSGQPNLMIMNLHRIKDAKRYRSTVSKQKKKSWKSTKKWL